MRNFSAEEVAQVLKAADAHLLRPARLVVIGGTAIGLLSDTRRVTSDLDVLSGTDAAVMDALRRAQVETGLPVPIQPVGIYSAPWDFEDRLQPMPIEGLRYLDARVPEAHDLALMKMARGRTNDIDAIALLHSYRPLSFDTLLARFREMEVQGSRTDFEISFVLTAERLYGADKGHQLEQMFERERLGKSKGRGL